MRELQLQEVLSPDTIHFLFGNLNTLVDFQRRFLIQLEEMAEKTAMEQNFGLLFIENEDSFTVYEPYCSNYFSAQDLVVQETPRLQKLADILNPVYELPSMLIKPVQRICKYPLLMQQLIKATNKFWPHFAELEQGLESVRRVTENVNETQREYENTQVVDEIKRRVDELQPAQIDQFGALLLHEKLWMAQSDAAEKEMNVYLFDRILLFCKEHKQNSNNTIYIKKKKRGSLQPKGMIITQRILKIRHLGSTSLIIDWKEKEVDHVIFRFRNEEQMKLWEFTLQKRMKPIRPNVSNTQLMSMKSATFTEIPAFLRTDDDSTSADSEDEEPRRVRHIKPLPRTSSHHTDYPLSPPLSHPSSPRLEDYPHLFNRSQSQSVAPGQPFTYTRVRSQSSPNIKQKPQIPDEMPQFISSRALYTMAPPSSLDAPLKLKLNFNHGIYVIMCGYHIGYADLIDKVDKKIRLVANLQSDNILRLKYQDEDGDFITINSDEDVQMAFENRASNTINLFLSV